MEEAEDAMDKGTPITAEGDEKKAYDAAWKNYTHRMSDLALHRGKVNALIMGQCQPNVMERIKTDTTWNQVVANADPLELMQLIRATVMSQTGDQYLFLTIQKQEFNLQGHHQATVTTDVFVEKFNTKVDVCKAMGKIFLHTTLIEYVAKDVHVL